MRIPKYREHGSDKARRLMLQKPHIYKARYGRGWRISLQGINRPCGNGLLRSVRLMKYHIEKSWEAKYGRQ